MAGLSRVVLIMFLGIVLGLLALSSGSEAGGGVLVLGAGILAGAAGMLFLTATWVINRVKRK